ncbi:MAG: hypothetical protein JXR19_06640 [Bacteroidia bacterium]
MKHIITFVALFATCTVNAQHNLIDSGVAKVVDSALAYYRCHTGINPRTMDYYGMKSAVNDWKYSDIDYFTDYRNQELQEYWFRAGVHTYNKNHPDILQAKLCTQLVEGQNVLIEIPFIQLDKSQKLFTSFKIDIWLSDTLVLNSESLYKTRKKHFMKAQSYINNEGVLSYPFTAYGGEQFIIVSFWHPNQRNWGSLRFTEAIVSTSSMNNCGDVLSEIDEDTSRHERYFSFNPNPKKSNLRKIYDPLVISSLNTDSTLFYTTTVVYDSLDNASISSFSRQAQPGDTAACIILVNNFNFEMASGDDTIEFEVDSLPSGVSLYWVDIDLGKPPIKQDKVALSFTCEKTTCGPQSPCDVTAMFYKRVLMNCGSSCEGCVLKEGNDTESHIIQSGFYLPARSIVYN